MSTRKTVAAPKKAAAKKVAPSRARHPFPAQEPSFEAEMKNRGIAGELELESGTPAIIIWQGGKPVIVPMHHNEIAGILRGLQEDMSVGQRQAIPASSNGTSEKKREQSNFEIMLMELQNNAHNMQMRLGGLSTIVSRLSGSTPDLGMKLEPVPEISLDNKMYALECIMKNWNQCNSLFGDINAILEQAI